MHVYSGYESLFCWRWMNIQSCFCRIVFESVLMCAGLEQDGLVGEHAIHQVALKKGFSPINDDKLAQRIPATASVPHDGASLLRLSAEESAISACVLRLKFIVSP